MLDNLYFGQCEHLNKCVETKVKCNKNSIILPFIDIDVLLLLHQNILRISGAHFSSLHTFTSHSPLLNNSPMFVFTLHLIAISSEIHFHILYLKGEV